MNINLLDTFEDTLSYISEAEELNKDITDTSIDGTPISDEAKKNGKLKGVIGKIGGIGADANEATRNGRRYPLELWQNVEKSEYFIEGMENRCIVGECDHPNERVDYSIKEGAIVLTKYEIRNDGKVYTEFDILDTLPGRTLKTYYDAGCKMGVSSRGIGEEIMRNGEKIIDPDTYQFYCFDAVVFPAVKSARMELIESTSPKRQTLINSIKKEINNCTSLNECLYIEDMAKATNLYLDEIRESLEIKKEEFEIANCDNPKEAYKATKELLDELEKLGPNKTDRDIKMIEFLKDNIHKYELIDLQESVSSRKFIDKLIKSMEKKIDEYNKMEDQITQSENDNKILLQKIIDKVKDLRWNDVDNILNEDIKSLFIQLQEEENKNNKIKISEATTNSDEDTPEGEDDSDKDKLQILAELQESIKQKDSIINNQANTIKSLMTERYKNNSTLQEKQNIIKSLSHNNSLINESLIALKSKVSKLEESLKSKETELLESISKFESLSKKYENLHKTNLEFEGLFNSYDSKYDQSLKENSQLKESINRFKIDNGNLKKRTKSLNESLQLIESLKSEQIKLNEKIKVLENEKSSLSITNKEQAELIEKLNVDNKNALSKYNLSLEKYIESTCTKYNVNKETLIRLLGENYGFEEIDKVAKELAENISKLNSLPFKHMTPKRAVYKENIGLIDNNSNDSSDDLDTFSFMLESKK